MHNFIVDEVMKDVSGLQDIHVNLTMSKSCLTEVMQKGFFCLFESAEHAKNAVNGLAMATD